MSKHDVNPDMWLVHVLHEEALMTSALMAEISMQMQRSFGFKVARKAIADITKQMELENANRLPGVRSAD
jgi:hypothetical protein